MNPTDYQVGQRVIVNEQNFQTIHNSNRSIHAFPSDGYVNIVRELMSNKTEGVITKRFTPGYEFNVEFDNGQILQMKDNWVSPC